MFTNCAEQYCEVKPEINFKSKWQTVGKRWRRCIVPVGCLSWKISDLHCTKQKKVLVQIQTIYRPRPNRELGGGAEGKKESWAVTILQPPSSFGSESWAKERRRERRRRERNSQIFPLPFSLLLWDPVSRKKRRSSCVKYMGERVGEGGLQRGGREGAKINFPPIAHGAQEFPFPFISAQG